MRTLIFSFLLTLMCSVYGQEPDTLKIYLVVDRQETYEYNIFSGPNKESSWDLPPAAQIRNMFKSRIEKENYQMALTRSERHANYVVYMDGAGWAIEDNEGETLVEKHKALYISNTVKDIVQWIKSTTY